MTFRTLIRLVIALNSALVGIAAHGSYVVEADGADMAGGAIATGAEFDFVTHDFGIESGEAIQIALTNLRSAPNLHGNLLLWSVAPVVEVPAAVDGLSAAVPTASSEFVTVDGSEDFSYYDTGMSATGEDANGFSATAATSNQALPASVENLPAINTNTLFWILKPAEFTSFSQMMAARFGF